MPYAGHFKVKSAAKRNRMARNKARGQVVSDEQIANNWDKIFNKNKTQEKKMIDVDLVIIVLIILGVGIFAIRAKYPQKYEEVKETLQDYWENLRTYFDK